MVHNDNNQIGIEFACRKPMYMGQDENRTANQNYLLDSNWHIKNEISEGGVICLTLLATRVCVFVEKRPPKSAYRVKDYSVSVGCFDLCRFIETNWVNLI